MVVLSFPTFLNSFVLFAQLNLYQLGPGVGSTERVETYLFSGLEAYSSLMYFMLFGEKS